ncbi:NAD(P)H-hydrate dehydratase [Amphiplicatus metriothermophilus]|uniref:NAD(P)H-hydrate dehydratase n=1 Tax=Amphiplicatus metriothermophilus TaxID=1519374 RepID=UPI000B780061
MRARQHHRVGRKVSTVTGPVLLTAAEMGRADALAVKSGVASASLMERAGEGVAAAVMRGWSKRPTVVLCGPGNNGGDGFVAARKLAEAGWPVRVGLLGERENLKGDAGLMAGLYGGEIAPLTPALLEGAGLIVDALFGTGLSRPLDGAARAMVEAVNAHPAQVLAVDLPSGIDADTGDVAGGDAGAAIRAARTVTFFVKKPGHVLFPGRALCGAVEVVDIGIPFSTLEEIRPRTFENQPAIWAREFLRPGFSAHKYSRGHAAVVSGGRLKTGAARLAARAALRAGAGLVTVLTPPEAAAENAAHLTAVMLREAADAAGVAAVLEDRRFTAALIGPGAGVEPETARKTLAILRAGAAAVLDADALTCFADRPEALFEALREGDILTPHAGEFARLFPDIDIAALGKLEAARRAAARAGATVILKGADTVVAAPDGRAAINVNAPPDLATAGSGDVLAGMALGLRAQGTPGFETAAAAVWLHGACGQAAGPGLIAEDLPEALPQVLRALLTPPEAAKDEGGS